MSDAVQKVPPVDRATSELEVDLMLEALGVRYPPADARETLITAYTEGRITFDPAAEEGTYKLAKPIVLANGAKIAELKFREPTAGELQFINLGNQMEVDGKRGTGKIDMGQNTQMAVRYIMKIGGIPAQDVAERIKARDIGVIEAIASFFQ